jgi:hypothetical protein
MSRGSFAARDADRPHPVVAANWRSQPISPRDGPDMATRPCGRIGGGQRGREAFGVRRPEPALWLGRNGPPTRNGLAARRESGDCASLRHRTPNAGACSGAPLPSEARTVPIPRVLRSAYPIRPPLHAASEHAIDDEASTMNFNSERDCGDASPSCRWWAASTAWPH